MKKVPKNSKNKLKNKDYLKIRNFDIEVTESEITNDFTEFLERRFPESLRKTGKRKWKSFFWVKLKRYYLCS